MDDGPYNSTISSLHSYVRNIVLLTALSDVEASTTAGVGSTGVWFVVMTADVTVGVTGGMVVRVTGGMMVRVTDGVMAGVAGDWMIAGWLVAAVRLLFANDTDALFCDVDSAVTIPEVNSNFSCSSIPFTLSRIWSNRLFWNKEETMYNTHTYVRM